MQIEMRLARFAARCARGICPSRLDAHSSCCIARAAANLCSRSARLGFLKDPQRAYSPPLSSFLVSPRVNRRHASQLPGEAPSADPPISNPAPADALLAKLSPSDAPRSDDDLYRSRPGSGKLKVEKSEERAAEDLTGGNPKYRITFDPHGIRWIGRNRKAIRL